MKRKQTLQPRPVKRAYTCAKHFYTQMRVYNDNWTLCSSYYVLKSCKKKKKKKKKNGNYIGFEDQLFFLFNFSETRDIWYVQVAIPWVSNIKDSVSTYDFFFTNE